jgi:hypothetical protein
MTLDAIAAGYLVTEVDCDIRHKPHTGDDRSLTGRANHYRDVMLAISSRRVRGAAVSTRSAVGARLTRNPRQPAEADA